MHRSAETSRLPLIDARLRRSPDCPEAKSERIGVQPGTEGCERFAVEVPAPCSPVSSASAS